MQYKSRINRFGQTPGTPESQGPEIPTGKRVDDFYVYQVNFSSLANGSTATSSIQIQADSDFKLQKLTYFADLALAAQTHSSRIVPLVSILITDTGSGRQMMDSGVPIPSLFGSGEIPFILPVPKIFRARSSITVDVSNYSTATTYNIRLSFIGMKIFHLA